MLSETAQFSHQVCQFFVSSVCLLVRVTVVDKNKTVVCCLLATSAIMLSEKKKRNREMCSKKWYLERNISCDVHLLNELLETDVPWDGAIVVWAGKLRKLWDSLRELRCSVCERRLERTVLRPVLLPVRTAQFTQFFRQVRHHTVNSGNCGIPLVNCAVLCVKDGWKGQFWGLRYCLSKPRSLLSFLSGMTSHSKIAHFNWECIGRLITMNYVRGHCMLNMAAQTSLLRIAYSLVLVTGKGFMNVKAIIKDSL